MSHILCRFTNIFEKYKNILDDTQILVCSAKCVVHVSPIYLPKEMIRSCGCLLLTHPLKHQATKSWSLGSEIGVLHVCSTVPAFCWCFHWGSLLDTRAHGSREKGTTPCQGRSVVKGSKREMWFMCVFMILVLLLLQYGENDRHRPWMMG